MFAMQIMYYTLSCLSTPFVLQLQLMRVLLISAVIWLAVGGLNVATRTMQMAMTTPNNANATINDQSNTTSQSNEKSPVILAAEKKVAEATQRDKWVGLAAKILLLLYVLITAAVAASSVWNNRTSNDLRAAESVLNDLQKEKIKADAEHKIELDTTKVREDAASELKLKADALKTEQTRIESEAGVKIAEAGKVASMANEKAQGAILAQEELRKQNLATETRLEAERNTRLELEASLDDRVLEVSNISTARLAKFAGASYVIQCAIDGEAQHLAAQLNFALSAAKWKYVGMGLGTNESGVWIEETNKTPEGTRNAARAIIELASYLNANDLKVGNSLRFMDFRNVTAPDNKDIEITIKIGKKENSYFMMRSMRSLGSVKKDTLQFLKEAERRERQEQDVLKQEWGLHPRKRD
jgi:hypothetical protein